MRNCGMDVLHPTNRTLHERDEIRSHQALVGESAHHIPAHRQRPATVAPLRTHARHVGRERRAIDGRDHPSSYAPIPSRVMPLLTVTCANSVAPAGTAGEAFTSVVITSVGHTTAPPRANQRFSSRSKAQIWTVMSMPPVGAAYRKTPKSARSLVREGVWKMRGSSGGEPFGSMSVAMAPPAGFTMR